MGRRPLAIKMPPKFKRRQRDRFERRGHISGKLRTSVFERDGYECIYCGSYTDLTLDHLIPWSWGGADTFDNLATCCRSCNCRKGDRHYYDYESSLWLLPEPPRCHA